MKRIYEQAIKNHFDNVIVLHGDDQAEASEVPLFLDQVRKQTSLDAVLGVRFSSRSKVTGYSRTRILGNVALNWLYSLILMRSVRDLGSGLNLFSVRALKKLDFDSYSDHCDFNIYLLLDMLGNRWRIGYLPITWREEDQVSNVNAFRMGLRALKALFNWKVNRGAIKIPFKERTFDLLT